MTDRTCTQPACTKPHYAKGACMAHYRAARRAAGIEPSRSRMAIGKTCEACGATFTADRAEARFCDRTCRDIHNLLTGQQAAASARAQAGRPATPRKPIEGACQVSYGQCPECGTPWLSRYARPKIYCSPTCKARARSRRRGGRPKHHRRHALAIHERDNWTCWLCGLPTSSTWTKGDPLAPTIDHLIPQALGGTHEDTNLGTAHALCNSTRGARLITALTHLTTTS